MSKVDFETDGLRNGQPIYCPANGWDCPYYGDGVCHIADPWQNVTISVPSGTVGKTMMTQNNLLCLCKQNCRREI